MMKINRFAKYASYVLQINFHGKRHITEYTKIYTPQNFYAYDIPATYLVVIISVISKLYTPLKTALE